MNCAEFESILADYLDGVLLDAARATVEEHLSGCSACREFESDARTGIALLAHGQPIEPPGELITRIAYLAPRGRTRDPFETPGFFERFKARWVLPILQPRLAMSMAMTILSFAMLVRCTGVQVQHVRAADLSPVRLWGGLEDRALRVRDQTVKYYENLRIVYEVETHLKDLEEPPTASTPQGAASHKDSGDSVDSSPQAPKRQESKP